MVYKVAQAIDFAEVIVEQMLVIMLKISEGRPQQTEIARACEFGTY